MKNTINFRIEGSQLVGTHDWMFLGSEHIVDGYLTGAIRGFNLPNAVAPGEWPNPGEGVTTDEDPRG